MFSPETMGHWYRRTFSAYVAALEHMTPYKTELEKNCHIESYVEAYLGQFLMNTEENRQSSGQILKMVKQAFRKFVENHAVPEWADPYLAGLICQLQEIYCGRVYSEFTNGEEIMYCPSPQLTFSPVLSLRRKSNAAMDSSYLAETALSLRLDANELLKKVAYNLEEENTVDEKKIAASLNELQTVLEDIRHELPSEDIKIFESSRSIRFSSSIGRKHVIIEHVLTMDELLSDDDLYVDAKETLSPVEELSRAIRRLPDTPIIKKVQFADSCGKNLCNVLFFDKRTKEPRRASYSFEDFERMATGRFLSDFTSLKKE